jgi:hypothetical protein
MPVDGLVAPAGLLFSSVADHGAMLGNLEENQLLELCFSITFDGGFRRFDWFESL